MNRTEYIRSRFEKVLLENINEKADEILTKLNLDKEVPFDPPGGPTDYVQEEDEMCEQCGSKDEVMELGGMDTDHPRFGKMNLKKMSKDELEDLLGSDYDDETEDDDEWEEIDLDSESDWEKLEEQEEEIDEKLYGKQNKLDKNKNGRLDADDFKRLRNMKEEDDEPLYEVEFEKNEFSEGSKPDFLDLDKDGNKKEPMKSAAKDAKKTKGKVSESLIFTENELISFIEKMVNEEKNSFKMKEPKGYKEYEKAYKQDGKENEDYLKSVAKKMTDYLKGASDKASKYEMKETQKFPTENGGMEKGNRKKYTPSDAVDEYIDAFSYPGQTNLVYDEIKPNDEWIEANIKGSSKTGNAEVDEEGNPLGNVVPSKTGEKFYKNYQNNIYGGEQMNASYKRYPQPVDQAGEDVESGDLKTKKGALGSEKIFKALGESIDEKKQKKINEEIEKMKKIVGYNQKTQ